MNWPYHSFIVNGEKKGFSQSRLERIYKRVYSIENKRFPVVLTLKHLSILSNVPFRNLYSLMMQKLDDGYTKFTIKKKGTNKRRKICIPSPLISKVQHWILNHVLNKIMPDSHSFAYEKGLSIKDCASQHIGCRWLLKFDIENFFPSITEKHIYHIFRQCGYSRLLSFELAMICTIRTEGKNSNFSKIPGYNYIGTLPQGASTSPKLANLVMRKFDKELGDYALSKNLVYTRYADDIHLSSASVDFNRKKAVEIIAFVYDLLRKYGFSPNETKTSVRSPKSKKIILGLVVEKNGLYLPKEKKNQLEVHFYHFNNNPIAHTQKRGFGTVLGAYNYINGLFNFAKQIEPNFCERLERKYGELKIIA